MPVYDHTYQTWDGERRGVLFRWIAIPKFAYLDFMNNRVFIWLFSLCWFQFILRLAYIYMSVNAEFQKLIRIPLSKIAPVDSFFFMNMLDIQFMFCLILAMLLGSNLISCDMMHHALVLYASKPISRWEYFLGKFSVLFMLFMLVTWFQTTLLYFMQILVSPANSEWRIYFWDRYAGIFGAILIYSLVISITLTLLIMAASSLSRNGRYAGLIFAIYLIATQIISRVLVDLAVIEKSTSFAPYRSLLDLGYYLFHQEQRGVAIGQGVAWAVILVNCALCAAILKWRIERGARYGR